MDSIVRPMRILIVDDEPTSAKIATLLLEKLGHEVQVAVTAQEGLAILDGPEPPAIVLLDWHLSDLGGSELMQKLRTRVDAHLPYIIMTAHTDDPDIVVSAFRAGVDDFTPKPFTAAHLSARIFSGQQRLEARISPTETTETNDLNTQLAFSMGVINHVIHEVATPLTVIDFLAGELGESAAAERGLQRRILADQIEKNVTYIRDILKVQLDQLAGDNSQMHEPVNLSDVVGDAIAIMTFKFKAAGVELDYSFEALNGDTYGNRTQFLQVIINMIANAIEAVQSAKEKWVTIKVIRQGEFGEVHFLNSGKKLSSSDATVLLQSPISTKGAKRGLGIRISQSILKLHRGELSYNAAEEATCFVVRLPLSTT